MRFHFLLTLTAALLLGSTAIPARAQNLGQAGGVLRNAQGGLDFTGMARQIFQQSDRNHNSFLNRREFSTAELLTNNTVANLGRLGLIGRGRPLGISQFQLAGIGQNGAGRLGQIGAGIGQFNSTITNTNHITQPQFNNYFLNAVARADAALRQYYAMHRGYNRYGRGYGRHRYGYGRSFYRPNRTVATHATHPTPVQHAANGATGMNRPETPNHSGSTGTTVATSATATHANAAHVSIVASGNPSAAIIQARVMQNAQARKLAREGYVPTAGSSTSAVSHAGGGGSHSGGGGHSEGHHGGGGHPGGGGGHHGKR